MFLLAKPEIKMPLLSISISELTHKTGKESLMASKLNGITFVHKKVLNYHIYKWKEQNNYVGEK